MELAPLVPRRESASRRSAWAALLTLASAALLLASAGVGRRPALAVAPSLRAAEADAAEADAAEAEAPLELAVGNEYGWWHNRMYPWRFVVEPHRTTDLEVRNLTAYGASNPLLNGLKLRPQGAFAGFNLLAPQHGSGSELKDPSAAMGALSQAA